MKKNDSHTQVCLRISRFFNSWEILTYNID